MTSCRTGPGTSRGSASVSFERVRRPWSVSHSTGTVRQPVKTLFHDVRSFFPITQQMHVYRVVKRHVELAKEYVDEQAREGPSTAALLPRARARGRLASGCRQAASTARRTSTSRSSRWRRRSTRQRASLPRAGGGGHGAGHPSGAAMGPPRLVCTVRPCRATRRSTLPSTPFRRVGMSVHIEQFAGTLFRRFGGGLPVLRLAPELARVSLDEAAGPAAPSGDSPAGRVDLARDARRTARGDPRAFRRAERSRCRRTPAPRSRWRVPPPRAGPSCEVIDAHPATSLFSHCARIWTAAGFNPMDEPRPHRARHKVRAVPATAGRPARRGSRCRGP